MFVMTQLFWLDLVLQWSIKSYIKRRKMVKVIYSKKATKFCEILPLLLTAVQTVKSKGKISQNFVAFLEYMNFIKKSENKLTNNNFKNVDLYFSDQTLLCCGASMLKVKRVLLLLIQGSSSPTNRELSSNQEEDSKENSRL